MTELNLPQKRLLVFAGIASHGPRIQAVEARRVEAVMFSYMVSRQSPSEDRRIRERFDSWDWPCLKLLDSGVFTFLRATGTLRAKVSDKKKGKAKAQVTREDFEEYAQSYLDYLKAYHASWDFVVELDVDNIFGPDVARDYRKTLRALVGDKLLPVWHRVAGEPTWKEFYSSFPYVGTGSDRPMDTKAYRNRLSAAHAAGAKVHGFGGTKFDVLQQVLYDTADSTTWLSCVRFGQFGGVNYRRGTPGGRGEGALEIRRAILGGFLHRMEEFGVDVPGGVAEALLAAGGKQEKYEIAIKFLQERQQELKPIPQEAYVMEPLI